MNFHKGLSAWFSSLFIVAHAEISHIWFNGFSIVSVEVSLYLGRDLGIYNLYLVYSKHNGIDVRGLLTIAHHRNENVSYSVVTCLSFVMKIKVITTYTYIFCIMTRLYANKTSQFINKE